MLIWLLSALGLGAAAGWIVSRRFDARVDSNLSLVREAPVATAESADLPPLLENYCARTVLPVGAGMRWFRIEQTGEMRMKPGGEWKPFTATQIYAVSEPSFVWRASFKAFEVVDSIVNGTGCLEARVLGVLPVVKTSGAEATRAQLLRYLAEIVWVPRAIASNRFVSWRQLSDTEVIAKLEHSGAHVELRFRFDEHGDIERVEGMRARAVHGGLVRSPWIGEFSGYEPVGGVRIPSHGEVRWELDSGPFTYWRATVTSLESS